MPNDKTEFLSRIRQAIRHEPAWHTAPGPILTPAKADGAVRHFEEALGAVGGKVYTPENDASAVEHILKIAVAHNAHRVGVIAGPATSGLGLEDLLARKGFEVSDVHFQTWLAREGNEEKARLALKEFLASADMVISGSDCAIAETGTLVLQAGPGNPRSATNLPPVHVAVVRPDQIIPTLFDAVSFLRTAAGQASCVTLITGPSRTSDIEQISTIGVHGPGELHVIFRK
jgi:L-lactate dehydrogenase complex protein LldG